MLYLNALKTEMSYGVFSAVLSQWKSGVVKQLGWTVSDDLLCVQEDGTVLVYDLLGGFKRHFSMGNVRMHSRSKGCICDFTLLRSHEMNIMFFRW